MAHKRSTTQASLHGSLLSLRRNHGFIGLFILAFLGFLDATYLTMLGFTRQIPPCTATHGCEKVLTSDFAYIGPIPIAAFGIGYFVLVMILSILLIQNFQKKAFNILMLLTASAFAAGVGLVSIQAFVLKAFCQYCLAAEFLMTCLFALTGGIYLYETERLHVLKIRKNR